jgi:hypothetical protein
MEPLAHMPRSTPGVDDLVEALMNAAGHINIVLMHMSRVHQATENPDADPPLIVLRGLLRGTLAPLADRYSHDDLLTATRVVNRSMAMAERDIIMLPPEFFEEDDE